MNQSEFDLPEGIGQHAPSIGVVLGSGLGGFVDGLAETRSVAYADIGGMPASRVPGHVGNLHLGTLSGTRLVVAQGRIHLYEGWSAKEVAAPVRLFRELGVETIILTNAAGIVNVDFVPGQWMLVSDHLNLARQSPLAGSARFLDQSAVYSPELRELLKTEQTRRDAAPLAEGVYAWVNGPEYETPAEIRMLRSLGADAVGMSTVPEAIQARALGMRVAALSCLTNYGAGLSAGPLCHEDVLETGERAAQELFGLLEATIARMTEIQPA
ncbi:MAG: purine-nucleoside phosphorylase [Verrucomicrobiales bacterium]